MNATVVVRNRASIPVPADSIAAWRAVCQALGHRLLWDEAGGILHVDSHLDGWTVVLDPAHGGGDRGGRGPAGHCEADFVLDVALRAAPHFSRLGAYVVLTRDRDHAVSLADRVAAARGGGRSLFISLHTSPCTGEHRVEVVHHLAGWPRAGQMATHLARWLSRQTQVPDRVRCCLLPGSEEGYGAVLWRAGARPAMPWCPPARLAVLAYLGCHGDVLGESRLADAVYREASAQGLVLGVLDFLMEYPLEERGGMRLLEPAGSSPFFAGLTPGAPAPADSAPAPAAPGLSAPAPAGAAAPPAHAALPSPVAAPVATPAAASPATGPPAPEPSLPRPAPPPQVPRVVGGTVLVPGTPPAYIFAARVTGSVQVPASWPPAQAGRPGAGVVPQPRSGQVPVRQPFG